MTLLVRTAGAPLPVTAAVRDTLGAMDATIALAEVRTLEQMLSISLGARRFQMQLLSLFGIVAVALATLGLSGVIAQSVVQRTREFGIRMALGAQPRRVLALVVRQDLRLGTLGIATGLLVSLAATRALQGALFGISSLDPLTYGGVAALLVSVAVVASWVPARRATRVDPAIALRAE